MEAKPLSKDIYDIAKELGVTEIILHFSGGSDEGYLNIDINTPKDVSKEKVHKLEDKVEGWAWDSYSYGGAGDGTDYGDDIVYDLETNTVSIQEWGYVKKYSGVESYKLEVGDSE